MTPTIRQNVAAFLIGAALVLTGCGGSDDPATTTNASETETTGADDVPQNTGDEAANPTASSEEPAATAPPDPAEPEATDGTTGADPAEEPEGSGAAPPRPFASFALKPAASGSNPLLAWDSVSGASLYRLVVLDAAGDPYWAWSGTETEVFMGATDTPSALSPRVFEPMTWQVSAYDDGGAPLAFSDAGDLTP